MNLHWSNWWFNIFSFIISNLSTLLSCEGSCEERVVLVFEYFYIRLIQDFSLLPVNDFFLSSNLSELVFLPILYYWLTFYFNSFSLLSILVLLFLIFFEELSSFLLTSSPKSYEIVKGSLKLCKLIKFLMFNWQNSSFFILF